MSLALKGKKRKPLTKEHKKNISLAGKGRIVTEETRKKLSIANSNPSQKIRKRISEANKGRKKSKKEIEKIKIARAKQILPFKDTKIEIKIQNFLKLLGIEFFTHQYMKQIKHAYQCDVLIPAMNLVIECDGDFIHCNPIKYSSNFVRYPNSKNNQPAHVIWERDKIRTKELIEKGYKVLRLWESEIRKMSLDNFKDKMEDIENYG